MKVLSGDDNIKFKVKRFVCPPSECSGSWIFTFNNEKVLEMLISLKTIMESFLKDFVPNWKALVSF